MTLPRAEKSHVDVLAWLIVLLVATEVPEVALATTTTTTSLTLKATLSRTESLVSPNGIFALGFFSSSTSGGGLGFGIWYQQLVSLEPDPTVVWMPRRDLKLGRDSYLEFGGDGTLALFDPGWSTRQSVWTSGNTPMQATSLQLQDTGNLVLLDSTSTNPFWQSFDTPTDTLLPGQSLRASQNRSLVSWRDDGDWSEGYYFCTWLPINGSLALTLSWNGKSISSWNTSSWSNTSVTISPGNTVYYPYLIDYSFSENIQFNGSFYIGNASSEHLVMSSTSSNVGPLRRATLDRDGGLRLYSWTIGTSISWSVESNWMTQPCGAFAECGPYAICSPDPESPAYLGQCSCPEGFEYVDPKNTLKGCKRILELPSCDVNSSKIVLRKVGDNDYPFANRLYPYINSTEAECIELCRNDCKCEGVVFWRRDPRCYLKSGPLFNGGFPQDVGNHSAYLKVLESPLFEERHRNRVVRLIVGVAVSVVCLGLGAIVWWCWRRRRRRLHYCEPMFAKFGPRKYSLRELSMATKNFSELIGRGGMGSVYKGVLRPAGEVVAVKRILHESCGGEQGFLAEASSIGQIRHRNLLQLKGWCIENKSFLLVYDYMPNGSLDQWLYSGRRKDRKELSWSLRFSVLTGVAAALEYLHEDWQQCVLHRDIKSSNVLLDAEFNAHLGDFGLARLIDHEKMEKTTLMAGTLGYMAPEMLFTGKATKETDVYSFGVLMLEVVCGKKPVDSCNQESHDAVLLHRVWRAYEAGDLLTAVDSRLRITTQKNDATFWASGNSSQAQILAKEECGVELVEFTGTLTRRVAAEVAREHDEQSCALKLGLLCCLPNPSARPSMRLVNQILSGDVTAIPNLPNSNQFLHLDAIAAINHNFQLDSCDQLDSCSSSTREAS